MRLYAREELVSPLNRSDTPQNLVYALWVVRQCLSHDHFDHRKKVSVSMIQFFSEYSVCAFPLVQPIQNNTTAMRKPNGRRGRYHKHEKGQQFTVGQPTDLNIGQKEDCPIK